MHIIPRSFDSSLLPGRHADFLAWLHLYSFLKSRATYILSCKIIMPGNKTTEQIVPGMSESEVDDSHPNTKPNSEIHIEDEDTEEKPRDRPCPKISTDYYTVSPKEGFK